MGGIVDVALLSLRPSVEVGLRHDGGDAETGAGMDVGGGLVMADASTGLAIDLRVRTRYHSNQTLTEFVDIGLRSYISEPDRGQSMKSANAGTSTKRSVSGSCVALTL